MGSKALNDEKRNSNLKRWMKKGRTIGVTRVGCQAGKPE